MIARYIKYGGLSGKVHAMYGKRLKKEDFQKLAAMNSVPEIAVYLKNHPGWHDALDDLTATEMHRGNIEVRLREYLLSEYQRIFSFMPRSDHPIMKYPISRAEIDQIMLFLRFLKAGRPQDYVYSLPDFYRKHSKIHFDAFRDCSDFHDFLEVLAGTPYFSSLAGLAVEGGGIPDCAAADVVLKSRFFNDIISAANQYYHGEIRKLLKKSAGMQIDLLNITHVVRLRRFFHIPPDSLFRYVIPIYTKLRPAYLESLYAAQDDATERSLLEKGPYGKLFSGQSFPHIEEYYFRRLYDFNHAYIHSGAPSVYTAIAYLTLREIELKDLINTIECVRYGVPVDQAPSVLVNL